MGDWHTYASHAYYVTSDGEDTNRSQSAVGISESDLILYCQSYSSRIPPGYFLGVAKRESGMIGDLYVTNEHDVDDQENDETGETRQYHSYGIFQMGKAEALKAYVIPSADSLIDPENNVKCAAVIFESNLDKILDAAGLTDNDINEDVWRYVAWAHNTGYGEPVASIKKYGLDWNAALNRDQNNWFRNKLVPYTNKIIEEVRRNNLPLGDGGSNHHDEESAILLFLGAGVLYWVLRG